MNINYKNLFYIFHPDGKFTEEQLLKILDAAYAEGHMKGYSEGYEVGKNSSFYIGYPYNDWWNHPYYKITCSNKTVPATGIDFSNTTGTVTLPTSITTASNPPSTTTTITTCNNKRNCNSCSNINCTPTKSESPYGMEFKYDGTEK